MADNPKHYWVAETELLTACKSMILLWTFLDMTNI
jgi:hypothetical protein